MGAGARGGRGIGSIEPGKLADLVVVGENPLANLKVLYGTGAMRLDDDEPAQRVGGVNYTIKDGIVYDAKGLLADVRRWCRGQGEGRLRDPARRALTDGTTALLTERLP